MIATTERLVDMLLTLPADEIKELRRSLTPQGFYEILCACFKDLDKPIAASAAMEKYGLPRSTISAWDTKGWIYRVTPDKSKGGRGNQVFFREREIAILTQLNKTFREKNGGAIKGWKPPQAA